MKQVLQFTLALVALVALDSAGPAAQGGATQKPPDPKPAAPTADAANQKPADTPQELPAAAKAFNSAMAEKNPLKRVELLEKFIAENPKAAATLVNMARSQVSSSLLAALKDARTKYQTVIDTELEDARKAADTRPMYSTYNSIASRLSNAGVYSEEAEDFARKGLAAMDERAYTENRKKMYERSLAAYEKNLAAYEKQMAAAKDSKPAAQAESPATTIAVAPAETAPATPAGSATAGTVNGAATAGAPAATAAGASGPAASAPAPNYTFSMKDGVIQASIAPPRPARATLAAAASPRPPTKPTLPTDAEMRSALKSERASAQATLGQILMKRGKADEGLKVLKEAYAAKPASYTMAAVARTLYESAKNAGNDSDQLEYLTVLALSGRATADEFKELDGVYRKTHNGSADGMEAMLDSRWRRDNVRFTVTPYARGANVKPTGRAVLAEVFPGSG
jgi:hypothetical protein